MKRIDLSGLRTLVMLLVLAACSTEHEEERIYFYIIKLVFLTAINGHSVSGFHSLLRIKVRK